MGQMPNDADISGFADDCIERYRQDIVNNLLSFWVAIKHPDVDMLTNLITSLR